MTLHTFLNKTQIKLLEKLEQNPDFWKIIQLELIQNSENNNLNLTNLFKLAATHVVSTFDFETELERAFSTYAKVEDYSPEKQAAF